MLSTLLVVQSESKQLASDWLNYYKEEGDAGLSSRNPDYTGTDYDNGNFMINGEINPYPLSYVLPAEQVMEALDYFEKYHELPEFITWHDDNFD